MLHVPHYFERPTAPVTSPGHPLADVFAVMHATTDRMLVLYAVAASPIALAAVSLDLDAPRCLELARRLVPGIEAPPGQPVALILAAAADVAALFGDILTPGQVRGFAEAPPLALFRVIVTRGEVWCVQVIETFDNRGGRPIEAHRGDLFGASGDARDA